MLQISENVPFGGMARLTLLQRYYDCPISSEFIVKETEWMHNTIMTANKPFILKQWANLSGGSSVNQVGVGDGTGIVTGSESDLLGSNKIFKTVASTDKVVTNNILHYSINFAYGEGNFLIAEVGTKDNQGTPALVSRVLNTTPFTKLAVQRLVVEFQYVLP